jgi:hypothetical protein
MRRLLIVGALLGIGTLIVRARVPRLHERLMARCEAMFERMPDTFPPKKMMRGIEEVQVNTRRILELLSATPSAPPKYEQLRESRSTTEGGQRHHDVA